MIKYGIFLEKLKKSEEVRLIVVCNQDDHLSVDNIFSVNEDCCDEAWAIVYENYPNMNQVICDTIYGEWVEADCLTLREAAEVAMVEVE